MSNKIEIRKNCRKLRESLSEEEIKKFSGKIFEKLLAEKILDNYKSVLSYLDFKNEVQTDFINIKILTGNKTLLLPRVVDKENMIAIENNGRYSVSDFGNREPIGEEYTGEIDLIIVPGVAFDKFGNRIGFGRGYYDRFFEKYPNAKRVAIAFDVQVVDEEIETSPLDKKIDMLITEKEIYKFS